MQTVTGLCMLNHWSLRCPSVTEGGGSSSHPGVICRLSQYGVRKVRKLGSAVMYYIKSELRVLL